MKKAATWFVENALIAAALVVVAGAGAGLYQAREVTANSYEVISRIYPKAKPELQQYIRDSFEDGKVTRWNYVAIVRDALKEPGAIIDATMAESSIEAERANLRKIIAEGNPNG